MSEFDLGFSASLTDDAGSFKLLELPRSLESQSPLRFSIKGQPGEDAVLCTNDATYTIRSVVLSNSILVVTPQSSADTVVSPGRPEAPQALRALRGREYDDIQDSEDHPPSSSAPGLTYAAARATIQASDAELARGLRQQRILDIHGALRPIAPAYLTSILETILNFLVSQSMSALRAVPEEDVAATLADENEISRALREGAWTMDVEAVVREIGLGILRQHKDDSIAKETLLERWKLAVGDTFEAKVSLEIISCTASMNGGDMLTYFPSSDLPVDPPSRFIDLFLTRPRWKAEDIAPFLSDIAVNTKDRDKLLLKYTRATTDSQGLWYTKK
ncbi:hypothetical protein B0H17DRAFT_1162678 [Mycena rosella]|uniref:Sister chromatid cohesion protein Dcc1 n=1 Tax=Mycena rosella TaxID=1033263 RepID=A0AAD7CVT7_MYCRO|nr:hypothetical protein B0H17DRAFT_1162678 [Mycena rosella]